MRSFAYVLIAAVGLLNGCSKPESVPLDKYLMGEKVPLGKLIYTVFDTQWLTHLGDPVTGRLPQNRFFLIRFSAVNSASQEVAVPALTIVDDQGRSYEEISNGQDVPQWAGYLRNVKPADSVQGNALFDAPPAHYRLKLSDESSGKSALIDIPLTFNTESPELPPPPGK
jgi:hypothetical protein